MHPEMRNGAYLRDNDTAIPNEESRLRMRAKLTLLVLLTTHAFQLYAADSAAQSAEAKKETRAVMSGEQVVQILDQTVDWYRTLGTQQQAATQPSDLLMLYANRQIADKVMALAFEIARANAELISSEADLARKRQDEDAMSTQALAQIRQGLDAKRTAVQGEIEAVRRQLAAPKADKANLQAKLSVLQAELDLVNARRNLLSTMVDFAGQNDSSGSNANALKAHIDAIAASIPSATAAPGKLAAAASTDESSTALAPSTSTRASLSQFGIWDLAATVFRLSAKRQTIEAIDQRTDELQQLFGEIRKRPSEQLKTLAARSDALATQSDQMTGASLKGIRDQYDTLAWLFQQTSSIVTPLSKASVLLNQYRRNLGNWRDAIEKQYLEALKTLGLRLALLIVLLAVVFLGAELWKRTVFRYVHDPRRRSRFLLLRKIVLWCLVVVIAASTFATELGSLATFAGLITAGLAVAMQSVLVSVVGYFFLIGKYGVRVGDRVQVGAVTGEVIDLGLVRIHLMELGGDGAMSPTGRVVAFANSIIFQASGGLFKQIPGVNLAWHEITLSLPQGADYARLKDELAHAAANAIQDFREDIVRQTREIQKASSSRAATGDPRPQVQLRFSPERVAAVVRYPVQLTHAAEIDERVSRELLNVVRAREVSPARLGPPEPSAGKA